MQILYLDETESTQKYLKKLVSSGECRLPLAVVADIQSMGVGSRDNKWHSERGNLFLSFALPLDELPKDLKLESASIYFAYILKELFCELGSSVWIKWPNDFYIGDKKIGGMITNIVKNCLICGVGINLKSAPNGFERLDIGHERDEIVELYMQKIQKKTQWKQVFSKYELEFHKNKNFYTHNKTDKIPLKDVVLDFDGSIIVDGERIYSRR